MRAGGDHQSPKFAHLNSSQRRSSVGFVQLPAEVRRSKSRFHERRLEKEYAHGNGSHHPFD